MNLNIDLNDLRSAVTLVSLVLFVGLMAWTWRPSRRADHDAAAQLPFQEDAMAGALAGRGDNDE